MFKREILIGKDSETNEDIILNYSDSYAISPSENITPLFFNNVKSSNPLAWSHQYILMLLCLQLSKLDW